MINAHRLAEFRNGHALAAAAFLMSPLAIYAPMGLAPLLALTALVVFAVTFIRDRSFPPISRPFAGVLGGVLVWGALSLLWSIDPDQSLRKIFELLGLFVGGLVLVGSAQRLSADERMIVGKALVAGICLSLVVYVFELASGAAVFRLLRGIADGESVKYSLFNKGISVLALGLWPAAMLLWRSDRKLGAALLALTGALIISSYSGRSMIFASAGGVVVFASVLAFPKRAGLVLAALLVAGVALAPALPKTILAPEKIEAFIAVFESRSAFHRVFIWEFVAEKIMERPVLGWGLRSSRSIPGSDKIVGPGDRNKALPLHPHNAPLQWWLELGIPGAALGAGFLLLVIAAIHRHVSDRVDRAFCLGQFTVALGIASLSFGAWQSWWLSAFALALTWTLIVHELAHAGAGDGGDGGSQGARGPGRRPA